MIVPVSEFAVSFLPQLAPFAGFALAVNLAYLNLKRWRYKEEITFVAVKALRELQNTDDAGSTIKGLRQFKALQFLAEETKERKKLPALVHTFHYVFGKEWDVILSVIACVIAATLLSVGVAHSIQYGRLFLPVATRGWCIVYFWWLIGVTLAPAVFVELGRRLVRFAKAYSEECSTELASVYANKISQVTVPSP